MINELIMIAVGVVISIIAFFLKRAFVKLDEYDKALLDLRTNCASCNSRISDAIVNRIEKMIDEKLDAWWLKVENGLMNEGRLPPRRTKKDS